MDGIRCSINYLLLILARDLLRIHKKTDVLDVQLVIAYKSRALRLEQLIAIYYSRLQHAEQGYNIGGCKQQLHAGQLHNDADCDIGCESCYHPCSRRQRTHSKCGQGSAGLRDPEIADAVGIEAVYGTADVSMVLLSGSVPGFDDICSSKHAKLENLRIKQDPRLSMH